MKCPFCGTLDNRVIDSRLSQAGEVTRRRRECEGCSRRYTTYERVEQAVPYVIKKDGRREPFDRMKILGGLRRACEKRPVSAEQLEALVDRCMKGGPSTDELIDRLIDAGVTSDDIVRILEKHPSAR